MSSKRRTVAEREAVLAHALMQALEDEHLARMDDDQLVKTYKRIADFDDISDLGIERLRKIIGKANSPMFVATMVGISETKRKERVIEADQMAERELSYGDERGEATASIIRLVVEASGLPAPAQGALLLIAAQVLRRLAAGEPMLVDPAEAEQCQREVRAWIRDDVAAGVREEVVAELEEAELAQQAERLALEAGPPEEDEPEDEVAGAEVIALPGVLPPAPDGMVWVQGPGPQRQVCAARGDRELMPRATPPELQDHAWLQRRYAAVGATGIAAECGASKTAVYKALWAAGVPLRQPREAPPPVTTTTLGQFRWREQMERRRELR
jgi:hypothetical protein